MRHVISCSPGQIILIFPILLIFLAGCAVESTHEIEFGESEPEQSTESVAETPIKTGLQNPQGRVIILGFDGVDPRITETMMDAGELPNLEKLKESGTYNELGSTIPPQSPTSWSSFTTCMHPGHHGVYDFVRREPRNYGPRVGYGSFKQPDLAPDGTILKSADFESVRKGEPFWKTADEQGARCRVLVVPFAFPADELDNSLMLCGLGVPDIRGTQSVFFYFSDRPDSKQDFAGGQFLPLEFIDNTADVMIEGAWDSRKRGFMEVPLAFKADRETKQVEVTLPNGHAVDLAEHEWSDWIEWVFEVSPTFSVHAISRIHALEVGEFVRLYMTCFMFHPREPYMPISEPVEYSAELADRYGLFKTIGWIHDTHAVRQGVLTEDEFLQQAFDTMEWRKVLMLDELDRDGFDLLIAAWTATDRVSHLFWHYRDPLHPLYTEEGNLQYGRAIEDTYVKMDEIVGETMKRLQPNDLLIVMSDHGFHSFRYGFNINTWLVREGYLAVEGQEDPSTAVNEQSFLRGYDWSQSRAYSLGLGSVYINIKGREGRGIVDPDDAEDIIEEIRAKLLEVQHPETGEYVFSEIYGVGIYHGISEADAPDMQLGYAPGFQSSKDAARGMAPANLFEPNMDPWSGEHAASDYAITPGILFSNRVLDDQATVLDLGVTALVYLGCETPPGYEGRPLL